MTGLVEAPESIACCQEEPRTVVSKSPNNAISRGGAREAFNLPCTKVEAADTIFNILSGAEPNLGIIIFEVQSMSPCTLSVNRVLYKPIRFPIILHQGYWNVWCLAIFQYPNV